MTSTSAKRWLIGLGGAGAVVLLALGGGKGGMDVLTDVIGKP